MYSTCLFCHASLGTNESIEHFPVGRRLVFDAARGRLWVVCRKCERWNLSPIEERWEAIEECERLFVATRLRVSTDNIGLTRLREGLELVRIGAPLRPEMAAWRYGDQFGRRRTRHLFYTGAGVAALTGLIVLGPMTGIVAGGSWATWSLANSAANAYALRRVRARIALPEYAHPVILRQAQLNEVSLAREDGDWALRFPFKLSSRSDLFSRHAKPARELERAALTAVRTGPAALQAAAKLLPAINANGATRDEVDSAVRIVADANDITSLFVRYAGTRGKPGRAFPNGSGPNMRKLSHLPRSALLALEMATHEDGERQAMEGELALLHDEWRRAEEIASISDGLLVSNETREGLDALRERRPD